MPKVMIRVYIVGIIFSLSYCYFLLFRSRLVEDGYRQLANLSSQAMKGLIRVKFVNLQVQYFFRGGGGVCSGYFQSKRSFKLNKSLIIFS